MIHSNEVQSQIWQAILAERQRQDTIWGENTHNIDTWLCILGEEMGEVCKAALGFIYHGKEFSDVQQELIHVAAVVVAIIEDFESGWKR